LLFKSRRFRRNLKDALSWNSAEGFREVNGGAIKRIAFGRFGDWGNLVQGTINRTEYAYDCVNFDEFDLALFDYAVPLTLWDAVVLRSRYGDRNAKYILPDAEVAALCADKKIFNETILESAYGWIIPPMYHKAPRIYPYVRSVIKQLEFRRCNHPPIDLDSPLARKPFPQHRVNSPQRGSNYSFPPAPGKQMAVPGGHGASGNIGTGASAGVAAFNAESLARRSSSNALKLP
jgi:hypothetical protein